MNLTSPFLMTALIRATAVMFLASRIAAQGAEVATNATFTRITAGIIVSDHGNTYSGSWADYDNDGFLDLVAANGSGQRNFLYYNNGDGTFTKITAGNIVSDIGNSEGCAWGDYDNDGFLDLFVANLGQRNFLYHNNRDGTFTKINT